MNSVESLPKTTFSGRRFTRRQLAEVCETVRTFKNLSLKELAQTLCEHLNWKTPNGSNKVNSCLSLLESLESEGMVELPKKRAKQSGAFTPPKIDTSHLGEPITAELSAIAPITLKPIVSQEDRREWQGYIEAYHYLGYKHPFGSHIGYFIVSEPLQKKLGCLLFSASAAWALAPRDQWIGWEEKHRQKLLHLILSNNRFLIFPWVDVPNLASHVLSLVTKQIGNDWARRYGYRPVLIETFVDTTKYSGTCYTAANWHYLGQTKGRGNFDPKHEHKATIKDIFVYPLEKDWKQILTGATRLSTLKKKYRNDVQAAHTREVDDNFVALWEKVAKIISDVASEYDARWQVRKRVISSLLLILLIYRLVCSKNSQSYGTTIDELWDSCHKLGLPLPQKNSVAPSSFCAARRKLDEEIFKSINSKIIETYAQKEEKAYKWLGHRIFAIDGSKVTLPRELRACGYNVPSENANYPQGMISCLYQLKSQMPFDFDLVPHADERSCAVEHFKVLKKNDVVVYDRGYFSYYMLSRHVALGIHAIFRLQDSYYEGIRDFLASSQTDIITTICPSPNSQTKIKAKHPEIDFAPLKLRLLKYEMNGQVFCLGTTLLEQNQEYRLQDFIDVYHARWGIEELYKISKQIFIVEDLHAKSERGVKQEIFAHFTLITMNRIFANHTEDALNEQNPFNMNGIPSEIFSDEKKVKANFKNCVNVFARSMEELIILQTKIKNVLQRVVNAVTKRCQRKRPARSFQRKSMKPIKKWLPSKEKKAREQKKALIPSPVIA